MWTDFPFLRNARPTPKQNPFSLVWLITFSTEFRQEEAANESQELPLPPEQPVVGKPPIVRQPYGNKITPVTITHSCVPITHSCNNPSALRDSEYVQFFFTNGRSQRSSFSVKCLMSVRCSCEWTRKRCESAEHWVMYAFDLMLVLLICER